MALLFGMVKSRGTMDANGPKVTEVWQVIDDEGDACNLGPIEILDNEGLPRVGMEYTSPECDSGYDGLRVTKVSLGDVQKDEVQGDCWREVTIEYGLDPETPNGGPGKPNYNKPDPLDWKPAIEIQTVTRRVAAERLIFLGRYLASAAHPSGDPCASVDPPPTLSAVSNSAVAMAINALVRPTSSAGQPFNPVDEIDAYDTNLKLTIYRELWDPDNIYDCYRGAINQAEVTLTIPEVNFTKVCPIHTLQIRDITGRPEFKQWKDGAGATISRTYWTVTIDLMYRRHGWYLDKLDVGTKRVARGDAPIPDGDGGYFDAFNDFPESRVHTVDITDVGKRPISVPTAISANGQPVTSTSGAAGIMRFLMGHLKDFADPALGLPLPVEEP